MLLAYNMKFNPKRMKKLEKEYTVMKTKEQEEMVELRVRSCKEGGQRFCANIVLICYLRWAAGFSCTVNMVKPK
jgi:hypothetical protein